MKTIEQQAAEILNQTNFDVQIGSKTYVFNKLSLENRVNIAALATQIPDMDVDIENVENQLPIAIEYGKYADILASVIVEASNQKSSWPVFRKAHIRWKKKQAYKAIMKEAMTFAGLHSIWSKIAIQIAPAFFLNIFTSLKTDNPLKKTKETDRTALS